MNKLPPEQHKALEEAKKKNAEIMKENQSVGKLNDLLKQARADNQQKKYDDAATSMQQATTIKAGRCCAVVGAGHCADRAKEI